MVQIVEVNLIKNQLAKDHLLIMRTENIQVQT